MSRTYYATVAALNGVAVLAVAIFLADTDGWQLHLAGVLALIALTCLADVLLFEVPRATLVGEDEQPTYQRGSQS